MRRTQGFTLLELLVAMAVLAIVIGLFSFTLLNWLQRQRLNEAAQLVFTELGVF